MSSNLFRKHECGSSGDFHHDNQCGSPVHDRCHTLGPFTAFDADCAIRTPAYGFVFNFPVITVASGADVPFSANGPLFNISHTPGTATIFIPQEGDYLVEYTIAVDGPQASAYALVLNGVVVPAAASTYGATSPAGTNQTLTGSTIIRVPANSTLLLRNVGATTDTLIGFDDSVGVVNASLTIHKVSA